MKEIIEKQTGKSLWLIILFVYVLLFYSTNIFADFKIPSLDLRLSETDNPDNIVPAMKIVGILTVLSIAPAILLMMTSFTRILIVLSFVRQAIGTQTMPPNQVVIGLSLFLTFFTMSPILDKINDSAITPYMEKKITQEEALNEVLTPMRAFMTKQTRESDLGLFYNIRGSDKPASPADIPITTLIPAFMISELKTAFQVGFLIYIPFLIIDMVISSILMAMGMMMLPPTVVSLPFKIILFVLADGWSMIVNSLVKSFNVF